MNTGKVLSSLIDIAAMLELVHVRQTTGRGPSYSDYRGQVDATIREARELIEELKAMKAAETGVAVARTEQG